MLEWREKFNALDYSSFLCECSQWKREPVLIGKNKKPRCFAKLNDISHPGGAYYFSNDKAWMDTEIMIEILKKLSSWMKRGKRNIMFLDNAPCHPQTLTGMLMWHLALNPLTPELFNHGRLNAACHGELETSHKGWLEAWRLGNSEKTVT